ncbi:MAG: hypothetical protein K5685_11675 [Bacteroidales bacterium]|nr:hypothetical protein [Bacteroidales bacterium]
MVRVFNPIYDTVFKYLVEDERVAKVLLSNILDKKIESVSMKHNDHVVQIKDDLKLLRIDFAATIINDDGTKEIATIEIQKAYEEDEVMRFKTYYGLQTQDKENAHKITKVRRSRTDPQKTETYEIYKPYHIYSIYILGHKLGDGYEYAVMKGSFVFKDLDGCEIDLSTYNEFIDGMTNHIVIIQIPFLPEKPKRHLEKLLSVFDQRKKDDNDKKYVEIDDHDYDEDYCVLVNRLIRATADTQLVGDLNFEDEMLRKLERDRINLGDAQVRLEAAEKKLAEKEMQLAEKDSQLSASIKMLSSVGIPPEQIAGNLKISVEIVNKLLK